jgi:hypothetical protein
MKTIFSFLIFCIVALNGISQKFYKDEKSQKYGLKNSKGVILIKPKYDNIGKFNEGFAPVQIGDKMSFVNSSGKEIVPFTTYAYIGAFKKGICAVNVGGNLKEFNQVEWSAQESSGKWGFINTTGKVIIPIKYDWVSGFKEGLAFFKHNKKWGFINEKGEEVIAAKYDHIQYDIFDFSENNFYMAKLENKHCYINLKGKQITPPIYDELFGFKENGYSKVRMDKRFGYIDKYGKTLIEVKFEAIGAVKGLTLEAKLNNKWGIIDTLGNTIVPFEYDNMDQRGEPIRVSKNNKWGFINKKGTELVALIYDDARPFENGLAPAKLGEKWGFIDITGKEIIPFIYEDTRFDYANNLKLKVQSEGRSYYIDQNGVEVK